MFRLSLRPNQIFHDLHQHPGRIFGYGAANSVYNIVLKSSQGVKAACDITAFNGLHEIDNGICSAKAPGFCKLFDTQGMKKRIKQLAGVSQPFGFVIHRVYNLNEFVIPLIVKNGINDPPHQRIRLSVNLIAVKKLGKALRD
jgi:hypothetical protein